MVEWGHRVEDACPDTAVGVVLQDMALGHHRVGVPYRP